MNFTQTPFFPFCTRLWRLLGVLAALHPLASALVRQLVLDGVAREFHVGGKIQFFRKAQRISTHGFSLRCSSAPISLRVLPVATNRKTSSSRLDSVSCGLVGVSPEGGAASCSAKHSLWRESEMGASVGTRWHVLEFRRVIGCLCWSSAYSTRRPESSGFAVERVVYHRL